METLTKRDAADLSEVRLSGMGLMLAALLLLAAGMPAGAAVALLVAGPATNLL